MCRMVCLSRAKFCLKHGLVCVVWFACRVLSLGLKHGLVCVVGFACRVISFVLNMV